MKKHLLFGLALALGLYSCNDTTDPLNDGPITINSDSEALTARVKLDNAGVIGLIDPSAPEGRIQEESSDLPLILVSQVDAPEVEGQTLRATHVDIDGDYAYVSYNMEGDTYLGAVDIFDISNPYSPTITEQATFSDTDISALEYKNGKLYLAAAVNIDENSDVTSPANLITVSVSGGRFTSDFVYTSLPGFVATDVANTNSNTAVTSGNDGVIGLFDATQTAGNSSEMEDLRAVAFGSDKLAVLSGSSGVHILDPNSLSEVISIPLTLDVAGAKRTLDIENGNLFVSEGANGAGIYKMVDGSLVQKLAIPIRPTDVAEGDIVTNAVSVDNNLLFMANGAAGISISDVSDLGAIKEYGVLDLDGSSNFVRNEEEFVFVATGFGGLQILKINKQEDTTAAACEGLPAYSGSNNLNVNGGETKAFSGAASFNTINNNSNFKFCGSLAVKNQFNLNGGSLTEIYGSFAFGQYNGNTQMNVNSKLILSGSIVIYGDLNLNGGSSIEFVGSGNSITIYGRVNKSAGVTITGDYDDTEGKLN
ncbi:hypothetical protein SAMN04489724_3400 [Algoriphagus locisalis]|uniref:LVIVD repeat-containing protein n=1 Tax=Algoriphagus locisalis TaxID=305507 RepID=A0A1I7CT12_9BACT|nr:hypothetical protein [Algoriphagus locisalis]SFU02553.1 hypothetical protein SAMN04489724_3400 [Algoriphagus locisalis]